MLPSTTGSLYDLGLGGCLVGVSDYCPEPEGIHPAPARVGGPKNPDVAAIAALQPDLVLVNQEENSQVGVEALARMGLTVWMSFPITVEESIQHLWKLARLFRSETAMQSVTMLEKSVEWARLAAPLEQPLRCFCPIWQNALHTGERWWMTFNAQTYPSNVLALFGLENVFAARPRRYPLAADLGLKPEDGAQDEARDTRYPRVTLQEIIDAQPQIILLPDEPYHYTPDHIAEFSALFAGTPAAEAGRIHTLDGSLLMWNGTRLARTIEELPSIIAL